MRDEDLCHEIRNKSSIFVKDLFLTFPIILVTVYCSILYIIYILIYYIYYI